MSCKQHICWYDVFPITDRAHAWWRHNLHNSRSLSSLLDALNVLQYILELFNCWMKHRRLWDSIDDALLIYQRLSESLHAMEKKVSKVVVLIP